MFKRIAAMIMAAAVMIAGPAGSCFTVIAASTSTDANSLIGINYYLNNIVNNNNSNSNPGSSVYAPLEINFDFNAIADDAVRKAIEAVGRTLVSEQIPDGIQMSVLEGLTNAVNNGNLTVADLTANRVTHFLTQAIDAAITERADDDDSVYTSIDIPSLAGKCAYAAASTREKTLNSGAYGLTTAYPRPKTYPSDMPNTVDGVTDKYNQVMPAVVNSNDHADDRMQTYPYRLAAIFEIIRNKITASSVSYTNEMNEAIARTTYSLTGYDGGSASTSLPAVYPSAFVATNATNMAQQANNNITALTDEFVEDLGYLAYFNGMDQAAYDAGINIALEMVYYSKYYRQHLINTYGTDTSKFAKSISTADIRNLASLKEAVEVLNMQFIEADPDIPAVPLIDEFWKYSDSSGPSLQDYAAAADLSGWERMDSIVTSEYSKIEGQPLSGFYSLDFTQENIAEASFDSFLESANTDIKIALSDNIVKGICYSSTYIPLQTNVYSADTLASYDANWLRDFHFKYGFMRKRLLKATSAEAAMDIYNTNGSTRGDLEVCTLSDFMNAGTKDIVLYIDDDFYNAEEVKDLAGNLLDHRASKLQGVKARIDEYISEVRMSESNPTLGDSDMLSKVSQDIKSDSIMSFVGDSSSVTSTELLAMSNQIADYGMHEYSPHDWSAVLKDEAHVSYSDKLRSEIAAIPGNDGNYIQNADSDNVSMDNLDTLCMPSSDINKYLSGTTVRVEANENADMDSEITTYDEYSPLLSYAYVSAIYRDPLTYALSSSSVLNNPVFISSKNLCGIAEAGQYYKNSLLNYMLVQNLDSMVQLDYAYSLDADSPLYMDVYGNIISESGLVVVPAASNATLFLGDYNQVVGSMALFSSYGNSYYVPDSLQGSADVLEPMFRLDPNEGPYWVIDGLAFQVDGNVIDFANMSSYTSGARNAAMKVFETYLNQAEGNTHCVTPLYVNIINEVMRGAPIGYIDNQLNLDSFSDKSRIVAAAKLEALMDSLESDISNTLFVIPDFTTMEYSEYIVGFCFKIMIAAVVVVTIVSIYRDAVAYQLGFRTLFQIGSSVALTFISIAVIPAMFQLTYYAANKLLLQDEVTRIAMYNLEKREGGVEIGVTKVDTPDDSNRLMVQLDWITVPWYRQMEHMMFNNSIENISIARDEAFDQSRVSHQSDVIRYNDGIYMSVNDIFSSVGIDYTFLTDEVAESGAANKMVNGLYIYSNGTEQTLSFYSPYYAFLYALTANVNNYNYTNGSYVYTTKMQSGNRLKTVGLSSRYFTSPNFMEKDYDPLHLYEIYGIIPDDKVMMADIFTTDEKLGMRSSVWYNPLKADDVEKRIEICTNYCREFIAEYKDLLMKVSDETFLKVMALTMAMKYNQVFGITTANCYEIFDMDSSDLLRMCLAKESDVMLSSVLSYPRFVMTYGGEAGIYAAALVIMIMQVGSFVKPACVVLSFIAIFLSIFVFKVVLRRKNMSIYGYFVTMCSLSAMNILHALILKACTILPKLGLSLFWCAIFILVTQIAYLLMLAYATGTALVDLHDLGFNRHKAKYEELSNKLHRKNAAARLNANVPYYKDNREYLDRLYAQHRERGGRLYR